MKSCGPKKESRKKTEERRLLNLVLSAVGKGSPTKVDACEEPDFIIQFGAERIGVEVTRLFHPWTTRNPKAWEGDCESVLKAAQRLWETKGLPHVLVNVTFNKDTLFPKNCWAKVAEKLVACAQQALPPVGRQALVGYGSPPRLAVNVDRPTEVDTMSISRDSLLPRTWWGLSTGGTVPSLTREIVQGAIDEKLERLKEYRKKAPTIWLIVGMESQRFSDYFVIDDPSVLDEIDTRGFDRVFVVPLLEKFLYELSR